MAVRGVVTAAVWRVGARLARLGRPSDAVLTSEPMGPRPPPLGADGPDTAAGAPAHATDIVARTLGGTQIWIRGTPIQRWGTRRGLMILRYLLWQGRPAYRETLMDLLWPNSPPQSARNNLNVAIYGLRRTLEVGGSGPFIVHRDGAYQIAPGRTVWIDAHAFISVCAEADRAVVEQREHVAQRRLRDAIALYRGPLFADDMTGEWYLSDRQALVERYAGALHRLATLRHELGAVTESIELCRRVLEVEPCREVTHRLLMRAYARQRLYHLVARQYQDCVETLARTLDVSPHPDTTRIFRDLVSHA